MPGFLSEVLSVSFILLLGLITAVLIAVACTATFTGQEQTGELLALNESHLFVVLSGATAGLFHYASFHLQHQNYLAFPTLQRDKYFRVRGGMVEYIGQCCRLMWLQIRIFYLFYWLLETGTSSAVSF
nr:hypothetical protein BaRGS_010934 [Batillaria attramentaria]